VNESNAIRSISLFFMLLFGSYLQGQIEPCKESEIYKVAFQDLLENYQDTLVVQIRNGGSSFLVEDINQVSALTESQLNQVKKVLSSPWDGTSCPDIPDLLEMVNSDNRRALKDSYKTITCSQPIFISESKALLVFSFATRNKNSQGRKAIGAAVLDTYILENMKWIRENRQALSWY
jgi:hypothetical protein